MKTKHLNKIILKAILLYDILIFISLFNSCKKIEREAKVETGAVTEITTTSARAAGNIIDLGEGITNHGHCWSVTANPTISDSKTSLGIVTKTGSFTSVLQNLQPGTKYYIKGYVKNENGEVHFGSESSFTTTSIVLATLTTTSVTSITSTTAVSGGDISSDGGGAITAKGVCWATAANPTISNSITTDGTGTGIYTSYLTGLTGNTTYYVRAYATNSAGTAYGIELSFKTASVVPTLTTTAITNITTSSATSGGNIASDGGSAVISRGVCWGLTSNPTITGSHTNNGIGIGAFISSITGLTPNTLYYLRAYATNSIGTAYGNEISFRTNQVVIATLTTATITSITTTTAVSGGNITSDGGASVTARGVCWATTENPTVTGSHTSDGSGTGSFISNITGLATNMTYYVRAFANNSVGTGYGNQVSFTTDPINIIDIDGNIYNVIRIGTQLWMKENLKTTKYNDGANIPLVTDNTAWSTVTTPAYCWYENNPTSYKDLYGGVYNWYAVNNGKLCPSGWHVPTVAGGKLKSTGTIEGGDGLWYSPNTGATNESGFTALPAGGRAADEGYFGIFFTLGFSSYFWSNSETSPNFPTYYQFWNQSESVQQATFLKQTGFSVRCVKD
jgi:uncharacterized protein (TIGR02145 family)